MPFAVISRNLARLSPQGPQHVPKLIAVVEEDLCGDQLRIEAGLAVARHHQLDLAAVGDDACFPRRTFSMMASGSAV